MSLQELFYCCKTGDIQKLRYLVEEREVDINVRDKWDSTPLYYACLCGHRYVVQFLLEHGAKCEANTFDGERCLYGALTDDIRNTLHSYKAISSRLMRRDQYEEFLRRLLESGLHSDVAFDVHGEKIPAHRCILGARVPYFAELFCTKWNGRHLIELKHRLVRPWAFQSVIQYLYTGRMETSLEFAEDCIRVARQCQLPKLVSYIEDSLKKTLEFQRSKPGVQVTTLTVEPVNSSPMLKADMAQLADTAIPPSLSSWVQGELPFDPEVSQLFADICFIVEGHEFMCHKAFFCMRSDYFQALIEDPFGESYKKNSNIPVITLRNISAPVFLCIVNYIYHDSCELSDEVVYDVLCAADLYLLPGLKRLCGLALMHMTDVENVVWKIRTARLFALPRLEAHCAEFIACNLAEVIEEEDFAELVKEDASNVKERQETDSIDIIDEIRYYIANVVRTFSDLQDADSRLRMIDQLLEDLGLDG
ncbi:hypothetical protein C0Q70_15536 [Pomacea canaliculata]|uniref:BTB domain-containing protein n=1 Tax=Pomacea canaliculata TaxID=400727 RepID=A0A2T7NV38_POMCA|nr:ankyrin repeat and BTB/POZ domain-containing protein 1-like [Pomacea canaliculata]PVD25039.1 hypothetical protein C0Q70_15536 [Pomacea canaliculata]